MKYRIKQTAENEFIPQAKTWLLGDWCCIDKDMNIWHFERFGRAFSICKTIEEAKEVIDNYKLHLEHRKDTITGTAKKMFYPKYHKQ